MHITPGYFLHGYEYQTRQLDSKVAHLSWYSTLHLPIEADQINSRHSRFQIFKAIARACTVFYSTHTWVVG